MDYAAKFKHDILSATGQSEPQTDCIFVKLAVLGATSDRPVVPRVAPIPVIAKGQK